MNCLDLFRIDGLELIGVANQQREIAQAIDPPRNSRREFEDGFYGGAVEDRFGSPGRMQAMADILCRFSFRQRLQQAMKGDSIRELIDPLHGDDQFGVTGQDQPEIRAPGSLIIHQLQQRLKDFSIFDEMRVVDHDEWRTSGIGQFPQAKLKLSEQLVESRSGIRGHLGRASQGMSHK